MTGAGLIAVGLGASLAAGMATGVGSLPALFVRGFSQRALDGMLGFAAGVMLAATAFSLIVPAIDEGGIWVTTAGIALGVVFVEILNRTIPHAHFIAGHEGPPARLRRIWLLILAITIHNVPEGLSVGVSFGLGEMATGSTLALAIGLQNMPEGLAVALSLMREGYTRTRAISLATLSGLVEPIAGLLGVSLVVIFGALLPLGLAFAAGAMLYVIIHEIVPESHRMGHQQQATFGTVIGFLLMMVLDNLFT